MVTTIPKTPDGARAAAEARRIMGATSKVVDSPRLRMSAAGTLKAAKSSARGRGPVEIVEDGPGLAGRLVWPAARLTIRPTLAVGSYLPNVPWPWGLVDFAARAVMPAPGTVRATREYR
jgi:hypothetical protein